MTISAGDIVSPVLTSAEVVVFFLSRVTGQAGLRNLLRAQRLEGDHLLGIALFDVRLTRTMTGFAASNLFLPAAQVS